MGYKDYKRDCAMKSVSRIAFNFALAVCIVSCNSEKSSQTAMTGLVTRKIRVVSEIEQRDLDEFRKQIEQLVRSSKWQETEMLAEAFKIKYPHHSRSCNERITLCSLHLGDFAKAKQHLELSVFGVRKNSIHAFGSEPEKLWLLVLLEKPSESEKRERLIRSILSANEKLPGSNNPLLNSIEMGSRKSRLALKMAAYYYWIGDTEGFLHYTDISAKLTSGMGIPKEFKKEYQFFKSQNLKFERRVDFPLISYEIYSKCSI